MSVQINGTTGIVLPNNTTNPLGATPLQQIYRRVAQVQSLVTGAVATGTTIIPSDNTIPQNTEGNEYMSLSITPTNSSSLLEIKVVAHLSSSAATQNLIAALFQDSTANALAATFQVQSVATAITNLTFTYIMTAGTTSATTFKVRAGAQSGTTTFNGFSGSQALGGVLSSSIVITEYLP